MFERGRAGPFEQAGLGPQYVRAGTWSDLGATRLPSAMVQRRAKMSFLPQVDRQQLKLCVPTCPSASAGTNV